MNSPAQSSLSRRQLLKAGAAAFTSTLVVPAWAFPAAAADEESVAFLDTPRTPPERLDWETLDNWLTPQDQVFNVQHYGIPKVDLDSYALEITGLVERPRTFTLGELKMLPRMDQLMTLECSGNGSSKGFMNAVYNSRWTGTPVIPLLQQCGIQAQAKEIVFFGADRKEEVLRKDTPRELKVEVPFGRSMALDQALQEPLLLAYERNGEPLESRNGAPVRLIAPGYYGIANVKWLTRIELRDRRYMGRYMARDYVTVRGERRGDEIVFVESSVARMNLKSVVARVSRRPARDGKIPLKAYGAAWSDGTDIKQVEVRIDDGPWRVAQLDAEPRAKYCWTFFSLDLGTVVPGRHVVVSRATDVKGKVQPTAEDDEIALKKTYWEAYAQWPREFEV